jgi:LPXTG-site transpeptidase (sortase) family protein
MRVRGLVSLAAGAVLAVTLAGCGSSPATSTAAPAHQTDAPTPKRVRIPAIGLVTPPLEQLGRVPTDHSIALPTEAARAGWFKDGPRPGQPGPAVVIGHVDWDHGPAVFFRLREMKPGERVYVDRADHTTQEFTVTAVRQVAKNDFPTQDVYAPDLQSSLRLITCGGQFDYDAHSYVDNVIVFASPV